MEGSKAGRRAARKARAGFADPSDDQDDPDLKVVDRYDSDPGSNKHYYKRLYEECIKSHKKQKLRFKKVLQSIQRQNENDKAKFFTKIKNLKSFMNKK